MFSGLITTEVNGQLKDPPNYPYLILRKAHYEGELSRYLLLNVWKLLILLIWTSIFMINALFAYIVFGPVLGVGFALFALGPAINVTAAYIKNWRNYPD